MADAKLTSLTEAVSIAGADQIYAVIGAASRRITFANFEGSIVPANIGAAAASHTHAAADVTSGTFADARIAASNVTQHQGSLTITESQISDLGTYANAVHTHAAADVTSGTFADARIAASNVTQHQASLTITESQISDLTHTDANAIHDNVAAEINAITEKVTPVSGDLLLIEDSAAANVKKKIQIGNLPAGGSVALNDLTDVNVPTVAQGDILYRNATEWVRLPAGTSGFFLKTQGAAANPTWDSIPGGGDMLAATYDPATISEQLLGLTATQSGTNKTFDSSTNLIAANESHVEIRNQSGSAMSFGDLVYVSGFAAGPDLPLVQLADASAAGTMPALGMVKEAAGIANNANGMVQTFGRISGLDTSAFSAGDPVYVSTTAGAFSTKPAGATDLIQKIGEVARSHVSLGEIVILGAGRSNDVPNTISDTFITLKQSATPTPTAEGDIQWDTDDNQIKVGDGAGTLTFSDDATNATLYQPLGQVVGQVQANTGRTIVASDAGKTIYVNSASAQNVTVNTSVLAANDVFHVVQEGAGAVTINGTATINVDSGFNKTTKGQNAMISVVMKSASVGTLTGMLSAV